MAENAASGNDALARLGQFFQGLTLNQRLLLAGGAVLVGATLWVFVVLLGQPKYVTLYSGLRADEAQTLASRLAAKNIPHQISADGSSLARARRQARRQPARNRGRRSAPQRPARLRTV